MEHLVWLGDLNYRLFLADGKVSPAVCLSRHNNGWWVPLNIVLAAEAAGRIAAKMPRS